MTLRARALSAAALSAAALFLSACGASDDTASDQPDPAQTTMMSDDSSPAGAMAHHGEFAGLNGKKVAGTVAIDGDTVTLSGFSSDEGPDLHLYLADGTDEAAVAAGTELGSVAFDEASQTFTLPSGAGDFTDVVVHCDKAKAVFGAAHLM